MFLFQTTVSVTVITLSSMHLGWLEVLLMQSFD